jgi:N-methylhydantoinase B
VGIPVQFLGSKFPVQDLVEKFGDDMKPGDVFLTNDPYHGGHNCHLPDWGFFRPIFYEGELLFFTLARAHQQDTGGSFPGGYFPNGFDIHAEGICIPPIKIIEAGKERTDVMELIWNNVRWPEGVRIDNYAMIASTKICEQRLVALLDNYGKETVLGCVDQMIDRAERAVREEIRKIPDGVYEGKAGTDDDGTELDVPVWVHAKVTIDGDSMTIDFSGSDAQRKGFINCVYAATYAIATGAAILTFDPALAEYHNEGTLRAIEVIAPKGLVVHCEYPATVGASPVNVGYQIREAVLEALSKARPERAVAAMGRHRGDYVFSVDPRSGERYVRTSFDYDGSAGAVWGYDGFQGLLGATLGAVTRGEMEEMEIRIPWRMLKFNMVPDFSGVGRWRGGPGVHWEAVNEGADGGIATGSSDGDEILGFGAVGGGSMPPCRTWLRRDGEMIRIKPHRMVDIKTGDVLVKHSAGGGGVGNPIERNPEAVCEDVRNGFVSIEAARETYGVVVNSETFAVDQAETTRLRQAKG